MVSAKTIAAIDRYFEMVMAFSSSNYLIAQSNAG
jgi:hypothetical protein